MDDALRLGVIIYVAVRVITYLVRPEKLKGINKQEILWVILAMCAMFTFTILQPFIFSLFQ